MNPDEASSKPEQNSRPGRRQQLGRSLHKDPGQIMGFTISVKGDSIVVQRVLEDGAANGFLHVDDELVSVNDVELQGKSLDEVRQVLGSIPPGQVNFVIHPSDSHRVQTEAHVHFYIRALYTYVPMDEFSPCKELDMELNPGDIICVTSKDDPKYWEGRKCGEDKVKIFPSPSRLRKELNYKARERGPYYERQAILTPDPSRRRPLVLFGPPGVGCHELQFQLLRGYSEQFAPAVPHTTREPRPEEENGVDYWFVGQPDFQRLKSEGAFIETGQFNGDLYGTSVTSVQRVVDDGKVCVLTLQPESLEALRSHPSRLMPYAVLVKQPSLEALRNLRNHLATAMQHVESLSLNDKELWSIVELGKRMEKSKCRLFDMVLEYTDLAVGCRQLVEKVSQLQQEDQWVPASWLNGGTADSDIKF